MAFWNFCHDVLHTHVYYVPAIAVALIMGISLWIQRHNQKKRDKENEEVLSEQATAQIAPDKEGGEG